MPNFSVLSPCSRLAGYPAAVSAHDNVGLRLYLVVIHYSERVMQVSKASNGEGDGRARCQRRKSVDARRLRQQQARLQQRQQRYSLFIRSSRPPRLGRRRRRRRQRGRRPRLPARSQPERFPVGGTVSSTCACIGGGRGSHDAAATGRRRVRSADRNEL